MSDAGGSGETRRLGGLRDRLGRLDGKNPVLQITAAVLYAAVMVALLGWESVGGEVKLPASAVGTVAHEPIRATHDFVYVRSDSERYQSAIDQAASSVLPVWDFDATLKAQTVDRVARAFRSMRRNLRLETENRRERLAEFHGSGEAADAGETSSAADVQERIELTAEERAEVATTPVALNEFVRVLQRGVDEELVRTLAADGFSERSERAVRHLVAAALDRYVVRDKHSLTTQSDRGIIVRTIRSARVASERHVRSFDDFVELSQVPDFIEREALFYPEALEPPDLADAIKRLAANLVVINTFFNDRETSTRRREAASQVAQSVEEIPYRRDQVILDSGRIITPEVVEIIEQMNEIVQSRPVVPMRLVGLTVVVLLFTFPLLLFAREELPYFGRRRKDLLMMAVLLPVHVALIRAGIWMSDAVVQEWATFDPTTFYVLLPFAAGAMLVRILTNAENALAFALISSLLLSIPLEFDFAIVTYAIVASIAGIAAVRTARTRAALLRWGMALGAMLAALATGLAILDETGEPDALLLMATFALASGLLTTAVVNALLPLVEHTFRYTTDIKLLELANLNHPALRDLVLRAPGTYHHSLMVSQLSEAACEAVGANSLLARVGAYYHDIGKSKNPQYFAENQSGTNPHDKLKPHMSALVLKAHVRDGVEMARQYALPEEIVDFIREHHGTSLIQYFYARAQEAADDDAPEVDENEFRYPGPKPQSRETAVCMLADTIEAASRAMRDRTQARLKGLVNKMINRAFSDGQLEECDLTLRDLNAIAEAFILRLCAMYHERPEYPAVVRSARNAAREEAADRTATARAESEASDDDRDPDSGDDQGPPDGGGASGDSSESVPRLRRLGLS